jgi:hypothetical protein
LGIYCVACPPAHAECTKWGKPNSITQERVCKTLQLANHGSHFSALEGTMPIIGDGLHVCTQGEKKKTPRKEEGTVWWSVVGIAGYHGYRLKQKPHHPRKVKGTARQAAPTRPLVCNKKKQVE